MTLAEVLPAIRQLTVLEKLKLIRILAEELDRGEDISPFEHYKVYHLPTPYDSFGAAQILANAMAVSPENSD
jgi:hypothetical protein